MRVGAACRRTPSATAAAQTAALPGQSTAGHGPPRLTVDEHDRLMGCLGACDRHRAAWLVGNANEVVRQIYDHSNVELAAARVDEMGRDFRDETNP